MEVRKIRPDFVVNVNISATQLENHGFRQAVVDILKKDEVPSRVFVHRAHREM